MLAMGIAIIFITLRLADYLYEAPGVGETIFSSFIKTPLLGTGVNGDLFLVSFRTCPSCGSASSCATTASAPAC